MITQLRTGYLPLEEELGHYRSPKTPLADKLMNDQNWWWTPSFNGPLSVVCMNAQHSYIEYDDNKSRIIQW